MLSVFSISLAMSVTIHNPHTLKTPKEMFFSKPAVQNQQWRFTYMQAELKPTPQQAVAFSDTENQCLTCCGGIF